MLRRLKILGQLLRLLQVVVGQLFSNGNTAGEVGSYAAAQMAAATGVPQSTWESIIARESNGDHTAANGSRCIRSFSDNAWMGLYCNG